jgi:hypothetical protein
MNEPDMQENTPHLESTKSHRTMVTIVIVVAIGFVFLIAFNMN